MLARETGSRMDLIATNLTSADRNTVQTCDLALTKGQNAHVWVRIKGHDLLEGHSHMRDRKYS
jgi:hypothetical protein